VFSGQGGDHLFQNIKTRQIAAEYAWHHGMRSDLLAVIVDTSRFTRKSIWSVMVTVFKAGLLRRSEDPYETVKPSPLFSDPARCAMNASLIRHPWVDAAIHLPSSKRRQIFSIVDTQNFFRVPNHYADIVHPLISQPIIEVCLQIPSYVLTYGGIDRALVRQAFNGLVPSEVLLRTTKGATTGYFHKLLGQNLSFLRGFLLDGLLMTEGVLDRRTTQAVLSQPAFTRGQHQILPILDAIRAEIWLRTWTSTYQRAAA
jgi:asparagine synthase (glutamine-hydrolysing)